jgi:hypothetical protein
LKKKIERLIIYAKRKKNVDRSIGIWLSEYLGRLSTLDDLNEIKKQSFQLIDYEKFLILLNGAGNCFQRDKSVKGAQLRII